MGCRHSLTWFLAVEFLDDADIAVDDDDEGNVKLHEVAVDAVHDIAVHPRELDFAAMDGLGSEYLDWDAESERHCRG